MPCTPGTQIPSKEFVREVYTAALGFMDGWAQQNNVLSPTPYGFIDTVSRLTGDRLRYLGAHADSSFWNKTTYLIAFRIMWTDTVDCQWMTDWEAALVAYKANLGSYKSPGAIVFEKFEVLARRSTDFAVEKLLLPGLIIFAAVDAWGEGKSEVRRRLT